MLELLRAMSACGAGDERDKIYALLATSFEKDEADLSPNYSLTTRKTFIKSMRFVSRKYKFPDALSHVQGIQSSSS